VYTKFPHNRGMISIFALALMTLAFQAPSSRARSSHFQVLPGQRILLKGDSITRGYGFGNYTDPSPLRSLPGIATILLRENLPHAPSFERLPGLWQGLNPDGSPKTVDTWAAEIERQIKTGELRAGDWLIFEDAGPIEKCVHPAPWPWEKDIYRQYRQALREMALAAEKAIGRDHIVFMTMFDYQPTSVNCGRCEWDAPLDDGKKTGNDAIRDEAAELGVTAIDMNHVMDEADRYLTRAGWGRPVGPDGIHPNVYGNYVMTLAILGALGADIAAWRLDGLLKHFKHPAAGGDVPSVWGFKKDPSDAQRNAILKDLRAIVVSVLRQTKSGNARNPDRPSISGETAGIKRILRHGRILARAAAQPAETTRTVSYEVGKFFQLDRENCLLVASMREQGGHDFEVGNDGFVFKKLSEITAEKAFPINRLETNYRLKNGSGFGVMGKFPVSGGFVPLGAKLADGKPHPAAGTGFLFSGTLTFLPDRSNGHPQASRDDRLIEFMQLRWDGKSLRVTGREMIDNLLGVKVGRVALSNYIPQDKGFLCPFGADDGSYTVVFRFDWDGRRWKPVAAGKPFITAIAPQEQNKPRVYRYLETEASIQRVNDRYLVYTRGRDPKGRVYTSSDGLNYNLLFDHPNHTVPQTLNQGLDGGLYLASNTGPGWLRNPLFAWAMRGRDFVEPMIIHDEKGIRDDKGPETPFVDHGVGGNFMLEGRWRHFFLYRVCDLRETNGEGAPPRPQTGLYLAEMMYR